MPSSDKRQTIVTDSSKINRIREVWFDSQSHVTRANTIGSFKKADICVDI